MAPLTSGQKSTLRQYMEFTGQSEKQATKALKATGWKLELAANSYFADGKSASSSKDKEEKEKLAQLFENYRESTDEEGQINVNGLVKYFEDIGLDLESVGFLVPVEIIQAPAMGTSTKDGFIDGWKAIGADNLSKQKVHVAGQIKKLSTDTDLLKRVYRHAFIFAKEKDQKAIPLETAIVFWGLLFNEPSKPWITSSTNWIDLWIGFLKAKWTKSVNKDMWNQTFEFFLKTLQDETLSFWSEDGAWPGVIDDFVAYAKEKRGDTTESMETD
ncbi:Cullin binding-domain-containing protein [Bisporella sp. PMI_857]|nr:Cullin binding-domain-containing protein [Bisporella sp. PMI_857]